MTEKIPKPIDALNALTEAMLALDLSLSVHSTPTPKPPPSRSLFPCLLTEKDARLCLMHTAEIYNRIQKIRRRVQQ